MLTPGNLEPLNSCLKEERTPWEGTASTKTQSSEAGWPWGNAKCSGWARSNAGGTEDVWCLWGSAGASFVQKTPCFIFTLAARGRVHCYYRTPVVFIDWGSKRKEKGLAQSHIAGRAQVTTACSHPSNPGG